jgi:hypothetical protein
VLSVNRRKTARFTGITDIEEGLFHDVSVSEIQSIRPIMTNLNANIPNATIA